jgi:hypothetical protein
METMRFTGMVVVICRNRKIEYISVFFPTAKKRLKKPKSITTRRMDVIIVPKNATRVSSVPPFGEALF